MSYAIGSGGRRLGRALRGLVPGTRAADRSSLPEQPLLSVVVPVYQVESYLPACLDSLIRQRYPRLEILVVDDGSTDGSADIARRYQAQDDRIRIVRQENAGLGAARNTGIREATGDLVTFVDSDDTVTINGYAKMVKVLRQTGSDFAVASIRRQVRGRYVERHWLRKLHTEQRLGITIDDEPAMLGNIWAVTKVFRRDFLERTGLQFPVGVRYEDQVPITRAYLEARSFDVLTEAVYLWRTRVEGTSITQQKHHAHDLRDRLATKQQVAALLDQGASDKVVGQWYTKVFRLDLMPYFRASLSSGDESYWDVLTTATAWLVDHAPEQAWASLELRFRVAAQLAARRDRQALARLFAVPQLDTSNFEVVSRGGRLVADLDLGLAPGPDTDELLRLQAVDLPSTAQLDEVAWAGSGQVTLRGVAFIRHLPPDRHHVTTRLELRPPSWSESSPIVVPARQEDSAEANRFARRVYEDHSGSGFSASLDLHRLVRESDPQRATPWRVEVLVDAAGVRGAGYFAHRNDVGNARAAHADLVDGVLVTDSWHRRLGWQVTVQPRHAAVLDADLADGSLVLRVHVAPGTSVGRLLLDDQPVATQVAPDAAAPDVHQVRVEFGDLAGPSSAVLRLECGEEKALPLVALCDLDWLESDPGTPVALTTSSDRYLLAVPRTPHIVLQAVDFGEQAMTLTGRAYGVDHFSVGLVGGRAAGTRSDAQVLDGSFTVSVPTTFPFWDGTGTTLWRDLYTLEAHSGGQDVTLRAARALERDAPAQAHGWRLRTSASRVLAFRRVKEIEPDAASPYGRQVLRMTAYADARTRPRGDTVLFTSFTGTAGDPGALAGALLARDPWRDLVWTVADPAVPVPPGTRRVVQGSSAWFEILGSAGVVVTDDILPRWFDKAPGQVLVQAWRGTALRRLGPDVNDPRALDDTDETLARQAEQWDLLVTPNAFTSGVLTKALGFPGRVAEIGSPRNDLLLSDDAGVVGTEVRRRLGVLEDQRVVLYAPTWRENARARGHYEKVLLLDLEQVTSRHPDVVVLVRGHAYTSAAASVTGNRVVDVTTYPDLAELYLAADALVTDHSAAVFDFALTDKPIVLLAPDLAEYQNGDRGLYVDLVGDPPGPVVQTTREVMAALDAGDTFGPARQRMRETYGALEDGRATQRLLAHLWPDLSA